ncbi:MAG: cytoplasmic protein [Syntrophales bacterium]|jgi:DNA-directed RNA polymerase subunit RPC12/RpoP
MMMKRINKEQYKDFDATQLYCSNCKRPVPVRKRLLLALLNGDKYDYICVFCGTSVGEKTETNPDSVKIIHG